MKIDWQKYADEYNLFMRDMRSKAKMPGRTGGMTSFPGLFIYSATRELAATSVFEIGTRNGISACTFAKAMTMNAQKSVLISCDVQNVLAGEARPVDEHNIFPLNPKEMMEALDLTTHVKTKFLHMTGAEAMIALLDRDVRFDIILIDGSHKYHDVVREIPLAKELCREGGLVILDDVYPHNEKLRSHEKVIEGPWAALMHHGQEFIRPNPDNSVAYFQC